MYVKQTPNVTITTNSNRITYPLELGSIRLCSTLGTLSCFPAWSSSTCFEEESISRSIFSFVLPPSSIFSINKWIDCSGKKREEGNLVNWGFCSILYIVMLFMWSWPKAEIKGLSLTRQQKYALDNFTLTFVTRYNFKII